MNERPELKTKEYQAGFRAGYDRGRDDGGEHDCRMFTPTLERAWEWHVFVSTGLIIDRQGPAGYKLGA